MTTPVDVTLAGYSGKYIDLQVPSTSPGADTSPGNPGSTLMARASEHIAEASCRTQGDRGLNPDRALTRYRVGWPFTRPGYRSPVISETATQRLSFAETSMASQTAWTAMPSAKLGVHAPLGQAVNKSTNLLTKDAP